jgi:curved DNA-binding protein CbpA
MMDFYSVLGVGRNATAKEIRAAYLELSRALHPDHTPRGTALQQAVNEAYDTLKDPATRSFYDRYGGKLPPKVEEMPNPTLTGTIDLTKLAQAFVPPHLYQAAGPSLERALEERGIAPKAAKVESILEALGFLKKKRGKKSVA